MHQTNMMQAGFENPVDQAQSIFRDVLEAISRPGRILKPDTTIEAPAGLHATTASVLLALADYSTPVWLPIDMEEADTWLKFHCAAPSTNNCEEAAFAVVSQMSEAPSLEAFNAGDEQFPDRSTTVILQTSHLSTEKGARLSGPGIKGSTPLELSCLPVSWLAERKNLHDLYPLGIDLIITTPDKMVALPRSTRIEN